MTGVLDGGDAVDEARALGPTLALLAALLVLGDGCGRAGLFEALAAPDRGLVRRRAAAAAGARVRRRRRR